MKATQLEVMLETRNDEIDIINSQKVFEETRVLEEEVDKLKDEINKLKDNVKAKEIELMSKDSVKEIACKKRR